MDWKTNALYSLLTFAALTLTACGGRSANNNNASGDTVSDEAIGQVSESAGKPESQSLEHEGKTAPGAIDQEKWYDKDFSVTYVKLVYGERNERKPDRDITISVSKKGNELYYHMGNDNSRVGPYDAIYQYEDEQIIEYVLNKKEKVARRKVRDMPYPDASAAIWARMNQQDVMDLLLKNRPAPEQGQATIQYAGREAYEVTKTNTAGTGDNASTNTNIFIVDKETGIILRRRTILTNRLGEMDRVTIEVKSFSTTTPDYSNNLTSLEGFLIL